MEKSKRQIQKEETKIKIAQSAYKLYSMRGFSTTTNEIAREAEVSHGNIFVHFQTRDNLIEHVVNNFGDEICGYIHDLTETSSSILDVLNAHLLAIKRNEAFYTNLILQYDILPDDSKNTILIIQSTIAFHFNKILEIEKNKGVIKYISNHFLFNTWLGLVHYYLLNHHLFSPNSSVLERHSEQLIENFFELIKKDN